MIDLHAHFVPRTALQAVAGSVALPSYEPETGVVAFPSGRSRPVARGLTDLNARRLWTAERGIDLQVLSPWTDLLGDDLDPAAASRWARLLNDAASDEVGEGSDFRLLAMLPLGEGEAATELERCMNLPGFVGGALPTQYAGTDLDDARLDDLFATAAHLDVPILVHPGRVMAPDRMSTSFLNNICGYPFETTLAALRLYFSGTFDRHPDLRLILAHCGGTLPMLAGRAAHAVGKVPAFAAQSVAADDILRCFYYDTVVHDPEVLGFVIHRIGANRMVLGTDAPFPMWIEQPERHLAEALSSWPMPSHSTQGHGDVDPRPTSAAFNDTARRLIRL